MLCYYCKNVLYFTKISKLSYGPPWTTLSEHLAQRGSVIKADVYLCIQLWYLFSKGPGLGTTFILVMNYSVPSSRGAFLFYCLEIIKQTGLGVLMKLCACPIVQKMLPLIIQQSSLPSGTL